MNQRYHLQFIFVAACLPLATLAQISTDASLGRGAQTLTGPAYAIPESLGQRAGSNLFHSFQTFNINHGESAAFSTTSGGIQNVISRVTGGSLSRINGSLSLTAASGAPSFYFINPAGITFGAGASINVPGAFHVSTANYLKFPDGNLYADTTTASTFSSAEPAAFGFLGSTRASIHFKDSLLRNPSGGISLVAGDLGIDAAALWTDGGDIRVAAMGAGPTEVSLSGALPRAGGQLTMSNGSYLYSGALAQSAGGSIYIAAGDASLQGGALVLTDSLSDRPAGSITAQLDSLEIDGRSATDSTGIISLGAKYDLGAGGNVAVTARGAVRILGGGMITSDTYGLGAAGKVAVKAGSLLLDGYGHANKARITSRSGVGGVGNAGSVAIHVADTIVLSNASQISSDSFGAGRAGDISLLAGKDIQVLSDSFIASDAYAAGDAGAIDLTAQNLMIDGNGGKLLTQVSSQAFGGSQGNAGTIHITTTDTLSVIQGGRVNTSTLGSGHAGEIKVATGSLLLDGRSSDVSTGIFSTADAFTDRNGKHVFSTGNSGPITIRVAGNAQILRSARVGSDTFSKGRGGDVFFSANNLLIDGMSSPNGADISSLAMQSSSGDGGSVTVEVAGHLQLADSGQISATTWASGNAGSVSVTAGKLTIDGKDRVGMTGIDSSSLSVAGNTRLGQTGQVSVTVAGDALLTHGGAIQSSSEANVATATDPNNQPVAGSSAPVGDIKLLIGGGLIVEKSAGINTSTAGSSHSGNIGIQVGESMTVGGGLVASATLGTGNGGNVAIQVARNLNVDADGVITSGSFGAGTGGNVAIQVAENMNIGGKGKITSGTSESGKGGSVAIAVTGNLKIAESGLITSGTNGTGNGGSVGIQVAGNMSIDTDGYIDSSTSAAGNSGNIGIHVSGNLAVGSGAWIASHTLGRGAAGNLDISARQLAMAGGEFGHDAWILTDSLGSGVAGQINVKASESIALAENSWITSDARSSGHAGTISVSAPDIRIGGTGLVRGAGISSSAFSTGDAGRVAVNAQTVTVMGGKTIYPTGIESRSANEASGNAGTVVIDVSDALQVLEGGAIASSTEFSGRGGEVLVKAGSIKVIGEGSQIGAAARASSSGQPGHVSVHADGPLVLASGGSLSIQNDGISAQPAAVLPTLLSVEAAQLSLTDAGAIKANATGNVAAGTLQINVSDRVSLNNSSITTSANSGNGGPISIQAGHLLDLNHSQITTSVLGQSGNGGDILVGASALVMHTGFIQANTAASNAAGGNVAIDVQTLLTSGNALFLGGQTPYDYFSDIFSFNVIQAAAPTGVSGMVNIAAPVLDISGSLSSLGGTMIDSGGVGRNPCRTTDGSSLSVAGRGGVAPSARGWLGTPLALPNVAPGGAGVKATTGDVVAKGLTCSNL